MRYEFPMPDIGEGLTEATISNWSVKVGDIVREDDPLCEIETDKALVEITAPCSGTILEITGEPGETLAVGTIITVFETDKLPAGVRQVAPEPEQLSEQARPPVEKTPTPSTTELIGAPGIEPFNPEVRATPATRRFAREQGVDLNHVTGTGPDGRILQNDITRFAKGGQAGQLTTQLGHSFAVSPVPAEPDQKRMPLTGLRKVVAEQMTRSVTLIPHASSAYRCDAERFSALRKKLEERLGTRISFTAMILKAMVPALQKFPKFNYSMDDTTNEIVIPPSINIGFATHVDDGLIVPVIKHCESKTLAEISGEVDRLAELARTRKIGREDLHGGTITLSNIGSHGRVETIGGRLIINHPQAAIIGISRIRPAPMVRDGELVIGQSMEIYTSYDHRIIDGIYANLFIEQLVDVIEEPGMMLAV